MARSPKRTGKGKRAKKGKIKDLPAGAKRGKQVKGGSGGIWTMTSPTLSSTAPTSFTLNFDKW